MSMHVSPAKEHPWQKPELKDDRARDEDPKGPDSVHGLEPFSWAGFRRKSLINLGDSRFGRGFWLSRVFGRWRWLIGAVFLLLSMATVSWALTQRRPLNGVKTTPLTPATGHDNASDAVPGSPPPSTLQKAPEFGPAAAMSLVPKTPGAVLRNHQPFGQSVSFREAALRAGVPPTDVDALSVALNKVINLRRCHPEDLLVIERDNRGSLVSFEYHSSPIRYYLVTRSGQQEWSARKVEAPVEKQRNAVGATIESSLADSLERVGVGKSLVGAFLEAFDNKVSFSSDTHCGDQFKLIVDKESMAGKFLRYSPVYALEWRPIRGTPLRAFWFESKHVTGDYFDGYGRRVKGSWLRTPVRYDHISSYFDLKRKHPLLKKVVPHLGIDYAAGPGTPVIAAAEGTVIFVGKKGANGNLVSIRHARGYVTHYAHLLRFATGLRAQKQVKQKQVIGYVGSTGRSTGPHLHFALEHYGKYIDPLPELNRAGERLPEHSLSEFQKKTKPLVAELDHVTMSPAAFSSCKAP